MSFSPDNKTIVEMFYIPSGELFLLYIILASDRSLYFLGRLRILVFSPPAIRQLNMEKNLRLKSITVSANFHFNCLMHIGAETNTWE